MLYQNNNKKNFTGAGDPMDFWDEFNWKLIPQNDPKASEPLWTTPYFVHHMNPNVKLLLMLRDPVERYLSCVMRKLDFCNEKTKAQISCAVTAQLISAFVFAAHIVQFFL